MNERDDVMDLPQRLSFKLNPKQGTVIEEHVVKKYRPVCRKGMIDDDLRIEPFGL